MSTEFAKLLIEELNTRMTTLDRVEDAATIAALIIYRESIKSVMSMMGHTAHVDLG